MCNAVKPSLVRMLGSGISSTKVKTESHSVRLRKVATFYVCMQYIHKV